MNLLEWYVWAYREYQHDYWYHRGMMNTYWPNPYKDLPTSNEENYNYHKRHMLAIGKILSSYNLPVLPRKAVA